jgi:hypothetical protein
VFRLLFKGSLLASFFLFSTIIFCKDEQYTQSYLLEEVASRALHADPAWKAILHVKGELPVNGQTSAFLSSDRFSLERELRLTIKTLFKDSYSRCRFPARLGFLKNKLLLSDSVFPMTECLEYNKFLKKVPNTKTYLVYASENVKSASSMLGHIMLRMDGINDDGIEVSHGITFFTEIEGFNVPSILFDSLIIGKKGYFQVAPYSEFVRNYQQSEQRNIWEYELSLTSEQKQFIRDITWELGSRDLSYFFHTYNCATVTQLLVASALPDSIPDLQAWLTPLDVVRFVEKKEMVKKARLLPSNEWQLRALVDNLPKDIIKSSKQKTVEGRITLDPSLVYEINVLNLEFYAEYTNYLFLNNEIDDKTYNKNKKSIKEINTKFKNFEIDVGKYKMPTESVFESQFALGVSRFKSENWVKLNWFPVANNQLDNKKNVFGETTLTLSDLSLIYSPESNNLKLENWLIYTMHSHVPSSSIIDTYSTGIQFGFEQHFDDSLNRKLAVFVNGQIGYTFELNRDLALYIEAGLGLGSNMKETYLYVTPKVGAFVYLVGDLKLQTEFYATINQLNSSKVTMNVSHKINWNISQRYQLTGEYLEIDNNVFSEKIISLYAQYRF